MTQNMPVADKKRAVLNLLTSNMKAVKSVLPKHISPERIMRVAFQAISRNPKLMDCTQMSIINSLLEASQLGLEIGGPLDKASLVPFWNKNIGKLEAQLIVGYRGLIELAYRSPKVKNFQAHAAYSNDSFQYAYGTNPFLEHRPAGDGDRGELCYAYTIVFFDNGGLDFEVVDRFIAMKHKAKSPGAKKKDSPWNDPDSEPDMWVKTAIRRISKRIPQSEELQRATNLDEAADYGRSQEMANVLDLDIIDAEPEPQNGNGKVRTKLAEQKAKVQAGEPVDAESNGVATVPEPDENADGEGEPNEVHKAALAEYQALSKKAGMRCKPGYQNWPYEKLLDEIESLKDVIQKEAEVEDPPDPHGDGLFEKAWEPADELFEALNQAKITDHERFVKKVREHYGKEGLTMHHEIQPLVDAALQSAQRLEEWIGLILGVPA